MILYDIQTASTFDAGTYAIRAFKLYKLRFYSVGAKSFSPKIELFNCDGADKKVIIWGKAHLLGTYIDVYIFPLSNPIWLGALIAGSAILAALGLTLAILHKVEDISGILYIGFAGVAFIAYTYRKKFKKLL